MKLNAKAAAAAVTLSLLLPAPLMASGMPALVPMEREKGLDTLPVGFGGMKKLAPDEEMVDILKEGISGDATLRKKDPLVVITGPRAGVASRAYQKLTGRVGGGIAKAFLRINDDTQVVTVAGGAFESYGALKPGLNSITVLAWDLEGNIGKDSIKVFYKPDDAGPGVRITSPADGLSLDVTESRVVTVEARVEDRSVAGGVLVLNNIPWRVSFRDGVMKQDVALFPGVNEIYVEADGGGGRSGRSRAIRLYTFDAKPKDLAAVLSWDSPTADFDLHVWDSFGHHTFNEARDPYVSAAAIPAGSLDMDRKGGYGPEIFSLESAEPEVYAFYVRFSPGVRKESARAHLRLILHGYEPSRRIMRSFGPVDMGEEAQVWEAAHVKMPEGVFFQEKDLDLAKTLGMDSRAVRRLALMLEEENAAFRLLAVSAMGQIKNEEAVTPLLKVLSGGSPELRRAAAGALWNIKSPRSVEGLVGALRDEDPEVRRAAAGVLGEIGDKGAFYALSGLLSEEGDAQVRTEVIRALGRLGDGRALDSLASQAKDPDFKVRVEAARALGNLRDARAEDILRTALEDKYEGVREVAAWALGRLGRSTSLKPLMDALRFDASEGVRVQAALALGRIKDGEALGDLLSAAGKDPSPRVRFCAGRAVEGMTAPVIKPKELPPIEIDEDVVFF